MGKDLYLVAGANGSGKSTIAKTLLPQKGLAFVAAGGCGSKADVVSPRLYTIFSEEPCPTT